MTLCSCSTKPSTTIGDSQAVVDLPKLKVKPSLYITTPCKPLNNYLSNDTRDVIKTTVLNYGIFAECASKMEAAVEYILLLDD